MRVNARERGAWVQKEGDERLRRVGSCQCGTRRHKGDTLTELLRGRWPMRYESRPSVPDHDNRARLHPTVEIDHILIGQPNATRRNRMSDPPGLVRAVDAIERVLTA